MIMPRPPKDRLAVINGVKPDLFLQDGEEKPVMSKSTGLYVYRVKRIGPYYHCTCPAWKNQMKPNTSRSCRHMKYLFGEAYEKERIEREEKGGDSDMDVDGEPDDELAIIDGIEPDEWLEDGETRDIPSASSRSNAVYTVKRTQDHFHCSCPAWRNQSTPVNARTCKHLQSLLGENYEAARLKLKGGSSTTPATAATSSSKPVSQSKPTSKKAQSVGGKRKKNDSENDDDDEEEEEEEKKPVKKARQAPAATSKGKGKAKAKADENDDDDEKPEDVDVDEDEDKDAGGDGSQDELAEINGVKPKVYLKDGDEKEVKSASSNSMYKVKRTWDHYYCACPAWRNQKGPVNARTCKHLQSLLGAEYETARLKMKDPDGRQAPAAASKPKSKGRKKAGADGDDDDDNDGDEDTSTKKNAPELLLANKWDLETGIDPTGWWISEKLDGVRTYFDGKNFYSRLGNTFTPPKWFIDALPTDVTLDGELFGGRQKFQDTVSIVKTMNSPHWKGITFEVFDIPSKASLTFEKRLEALEALFGAQGSHKCDHVNIVQHEQAKDKDHVLEKLKEIEELGGEGLMLREPKSKYERARSSTLLKVKTFYDAEAVVTGYVPGKGRNVGVTGALKCQMESGKTFNVGTGLSDKQRRDPPKIGSIIVYRFQELTRDKVPRFPSFVGEAADKKVPKDADIPATRMP